MPPDFYINVGLANDLSSFLTIFPPRGHAVFEFSAELGYLGNSSTATGAISTAGEGRPELNWAS